MCKVRGQEPIFYQLYYMKTCSILGSISFHSCSFLKYNNKVAEKHHQDSEKAPSGNEGNGNAKENKKKLKGKRAVVRWLKFFRFKKKKEYERMTSEEKILYKLLKVSFIFYFIWTFLLFSNSMVLLILYFFHLCLPVLAISIHTFVFIISIFILLTACVHLLA